jgi:DNA-binding MarR family transcriptional regulator
MENIPSRNDDEISNLSYIAKILLRESDDRGRYFDHGIFSDSAWRLLLDLYIHTAVGQPVSVTSACMASGVPTATAHRWITMLVETGMIEKAADAADRRRFNLGLSQSAFKDMSRYLAGIAKVDARRRLPIPGMADAGSEADREFRMSSAPILFA